MKKITLAAFAALTVGGVYMSFAQAKTPSSYFPDSLVQEKAGMSPDTCRQMMSEVAGMKDAQSAMDRKIDLMVSTMNETTGDSKANATAAVVTELVSQRTLSRGMHSRMDGKMHMHMMMHAKSGRMGCPMMDASIPPK